MNTAKPPRAADRGWRRLAWFLPRDVTPSSVPILQNIGWLVSEQMLGTLLRVTVGLWVVRYLGPEDFGKLSYCFAFLGFVMGAARMGLDDVVTRAFALRVAAGTLLTAAMVVAAQTVLASQRDVEIILLLLAPLALVPSLEIVKSWYDAQVKAKYVVLAQSGFVVICALARVALILIGAPLIAFGAITVVEVAAPWLVIFAIFHRQGGALRRHGVSIERMKELLRGGLPLFLSGFAVLACMRTDVVMLQWMAGAEATGIYASAVRLSEVWYMFPMAVAVSTAPALIRTKAHGEGHQRYRFRQLLRMMLALSIAAALTMSGVADWLVVVLFGSAFAASADVLKVHAWTVACVSVGCITTRLLVAEKLQSVVLRTTILGAAANLVLNYFAIPLYGPIGAALATLVSQALSTSLGLAVCGARARRILADQFLALVWWDVWPERARRRTAKLLALRSTM